MTGVVCYHLDAWSLLGKVLAISVPNMPNFGIIVLSQINQQIEWLSPWDILIHIICRLAWNHFGLAH